MDFKREIVGNGGTQKVLHNHHNQNILGFYQQQLGITGTHMGRHRLNWQINGFYQHNPDATSKH